MAKMIPERPRSFSKESLEDVMFNSLEKLPNDYYVFHSFRIVSVNENKIKESETDFVIFNRNKGILCIEAKAGHVAYDNGVWKYGSGITMRHDGPYNQAAKNKWAIKDLILVSAYPELLKKCKLLHAVWFPSITNSELQSKILAPEAEKAITLTKEALDNTEEAIEALFEQTVANNTETFLSENDKTLLITKILCPSFDLVPSISLEADLNKQVFHRMLKEQKCVLNFLTEQRTAVIQGVAGTGKTLIALEKARRHADAGEKVLFLCYNKYLQEYVAGKNKHENIDFYTIDGYACKLSNASTPDYEKVKDVLENYYITGEFPYNHIIIDEGQDFGQDELEENSIITLLSEIMVDRDEGTFYIFYDSLQLVQGKKVPEYILNADCKLTLYKNCRNTENIAKTSIKPLRVSKNKMIEGCIAGSIPRIYYCDNEAKHIDAINSLITEYHMQGIEDIVILTCQTEQSSFLSAYIDSGKYRKCRFTTCRKYKGLEADAVILVDVSKKILLNDAAKVFYVGASRARLKLDIIASLNSDDCIDILEKFQINKKRNPQKRLATELNALYIRM